MEDYLKKKTRAQKVELSVDVILCNCLSLSILDSIRQNTA